MCSVSSRNDVETGCNVDGCGAVDLDRGYQSAVDSKDLDIGGLGSHDIDAVNTCANGETVNIGIDDAGGFLEYHAVGTGRFATVVNSCHLVGVLALGYLGVYK